MARWAAFAFGLLLAAPALAQAQPAFTPSVLSASDVTRYREIFAAERAGKFAKAKALYGKLDDTSLEGYVKAEHILSPHSKRTPVADLVAWLRDYGDLPIAERVYKLAVKRATRHIHKRHHKVVTVMTAEIPLPTAPHHRGGGYEDLEAREPPLLSDAARAVQEEIGSAIHSDQPDQAYATLQALIAANTAPASDIALLTERVCASYLAEGFDDKAYALASAAAETGRADAPMLDWCAGLAAFRLAHYDDAAKHFETLAQVGWLPAGTRSAAAFWAARALLRTGDPERVVGLLTLAAQEEPTFYGLLAERLLGEDVQTGFADPVLLPGDFDKIAALPAAHRAVALWQVGENEDKYVGPELSRAFGEAAALKLDASFAALARRLDVPNVELRASETSASRGLLLTGLFPIPQYKPLGDYTIDPSLVLAVVRIETRFVADAVSPAGAKGLMQLMPSTAAHIGGHGAEDKLFDPSYNMTLGQRYIAELLDLYDGNLIELGAAYNAGPLKVSAWKAARDGKEDDPLMFIESMRAPETRAYVKRLLVYYWMYHRRDGTAAGSLDEAARGGWPVYRAPEQSAPPPPPADSDEDEDNPDAPNPSS
jgi:soluble lytic murein transglycosylase-like protein